MDVNLLSKIQAQIDRAYEKHQEYASFAEAMSIFREEFEELWQECKKKELDFECIENEIIDNVVVLLKMHNDIVIKRNNR